MRAERRRIGGLLLAQDAGPDGRRPLLAGRGLRRGERPGFVAGRRPVQVPAALGTSTSTLRGDAAQGPEDAAGAGLVSTAGHLLDGGRKRRPPGRVRYTE